VARSKLSAIGQAFLKQKPIERALRRAAANAIEQHTQAGLPLVIWRDGKTVFGLRRGARASPQTQETDG
jgi:hypothetical protein